MKRILLILVIGLFMLGCQEAAMEAHAEEPAPEPPALEREADPEPEVQAEAEPFPEPEPTLEPEGPVEITMTARKWDFEPETFTVNKGDTVNLVVTSVDVKHGISLPEFGINEDLRPGETVEILFTADKAGTFPFFCSVSCGSGHGSMRGELIVR